MVNAKSRYGTVIVAAVAASCLMLAFNLMHRVVAGRGAGSVSAFPIDPGAIQRFPLQIGDWTGEDVSLDDRVVRATDSDAHINRRYSRDGGLDAVSVFIACGTRVRAMMMHRPEVCYPGAGWTLVHRRLVDLPLDDGRELTCSLFEFSSGGLDTNRVIVLNYFVVNGQYSADISFLQSKAWTAYRSVDYVAQVQIVASAEALTVDVATRRVSAFAVESAPAVARLFEKLEEDRRENEARETLKGK